MTRHELTYDQRKAAEAAFRGQPPDPRWSSGALAVYEGLLKAIPGTRPPLLQELSRQAATGEADFMTPEDTWPQSHDAEREPTASTSRQEAIVTGRLIDITPQAHDLGLTLPVGLTRSLWKFVITASETVPETHYEDRVRNLLSAVQFHLSRLPAATTFSQFPALLGFPPSQTPKLCAICAVVHSDPADPSSEKFLTLFLPSELPEHLPPFTQ